MPFPTRVLWHHGISMGPCWWAPLPLAATLNARACWWATRFSKFRATRSARSRATSWRASLLAIRSQ
jgi:hypothetical protein